MDYVDMVINSKFACKGRNGLLILFFVILCQLDVIFKSLGFTQKKADSQVRWAVLNTVTLLRRHMAAHDKLARAMSESKSIGDCIEILESSLANIKDL